MRGRKRRGHGEHSRGRRDERPRASRDRRATGPVAWSDGAGELLAAFALSEPEAGSDAAALRTEAVADGDTWVLSGTKAWVTNGVRADVVIAFARTDTTPGAPSRGLSAFVIPTSASGYAPAPKADTMGLRALAAVRVDSGSRPGTRRKSRRHAWPGFRYAMEASSVGRLGTAAQAVGLAPRRTRAGHRLLRRAPAVRPAPAGVRGGAVQARRHGDADGGRPRASFSPRLARATTAAVRRAGQHGQAVLLRDRDVGDDPRRATLRGYGYMRDFPVEKLFRDAKATEIYEGTSEIQRLIIARHLYADRDGPQRDEERVARPGLRLRFARTGLRRYHPTIMKTLATRGPPRPLGSGRSRGPRAHSTRSGTPGARARADRERELRLRGRARGHGHRR